MIWFGEGALYCCQQSFNVSNSLGSYLFFYQEVASTGDMPVYVYLEKGYYYPIRMVLANSNGPSQLQFHFIDPNGEQISDFDTVYSHDDLDEGCASNLVVQETFTLTSPICHETDTYTYSTIAISTYADDSVRTLTQIIVQVPGTCSLLTMSITSGTISESYESTITVTNSIGTFSTTEDVIIVPTTLFNTMTITSGSVPTEFTSTFSTTDSSGNPTTTSVYVIDFPSKIISPPYGNVSMPNFNSVLSSSSDLAIFTPVTVADITSMLDHELWSLSSSIFSSSNSNYDLFSSPKESTHKALTTTAYIISTVVKTKTSCSTFCDSKGDIVTTTYTTVITPECSYGTRNNGGSFESIATSLESKIFASSTSVSMKVQVTEVVIPFSTEKLSSNTRIINDSTISAVNKSNKLNFDVTTTNISIKTYSTIESESELKTVSSSYSVAVYDAGANFVTASWCLCGLIALVF